MLSITFNDAREINDQSRYAPFSFVSQFGGRFTILGPFGNIHQAESVKHFQDSSVKYPEFLEASTLSYTPGMLAAQA